MNHSLLLDLSLFNFMNICTLIFGSPFVVVLLLLLCQLYLLLETTFPSLLIPTLILWNPLWRLLLLLLVSLWLSLIPSAIIIVISSPVIKSSSPNSSFAIDNSTIIVVIVLIILPLIYRRLLLCGYVAIIRFVILCSIVIYQWLSAPSSKIIVFTWILRERRGLGVLEGTSVISIHLIF